MPKERGRKNNGMKKLFVNGKIFTSDRERLYADAMLVDDGRIVWLGERAELAGPACEECGNPAKAQVIDLQGRTVIPGFVDAHMHPMMLAEYSRQIACLPPKVNSIRELTREIARVAGETNQDGWIRGWGYDEGKYAEKRSPNRYDLDKGSSDKPVFLVRCCEHIRCVNSKALEIAGITKDTPDPPGGSIDRDERGEPTGILRENARDLILPFLPAESESETVSALVDLSKLLTSQGIVAIADMGNLHPGGNYEYFAKASERGFRQRVAMYYMWDYFMDDADFDLLMEAANGNEEGDDGSLRVAGIKLIGDGSISGRTAWLKRPYMGTDDYGMPVYSDESMEKAIAFAKKHGCQIAVHAMGGRAIDRAVDRVYEEEDWTCGRAPYFRVEHLTEPSAEAIAKAAEKGFAFATQPIFEYCEIETYRKNIEPERLKTLYPLKSELDAGVKLCLSTDAPATSWAEPSDPFPNIKSAVTGRACDGTDIGQEEIIDMETAIILYTKNAAETCGFDGLGQLKPGFSADFAVLSEDIFDIDPARIDQVRVEETYMRGEQVYKR